jgi:hypothetical protein
MGILSGSSLRETVRWVRERMASGRELAEHPLPRPTIETHFAAITSVTQTEGRYPGTLYRRDQSGASAAFTQVGDAGAIWVDTLEGDQLFTGKKFAVRLTGAKAADDKPVYDAIGIPFPVLWGKLDGELAYQDSATMSVWSGSGAGSDTGVNVTVHDGPLSSGQTIAANKFITAFWDAASGLYRVPGVQCA